MNNKVAIYIKLKLFVVHSLVMSDEFHFLEIRTFWWKIKFNDFKLLISSNLKVLNCTNFNGSIKL